NQIEKMLGNCTFEKEEKRAPKASYTFEYFKLLQDINHIKINKYDFETRKIEKRELTEEERQKIIKLAKEKANITYSTLRKELNLDRNERFNMLSYKNILMWSDETNEEVEKANKFKEFESYNKIKTALNRIEKGYIEK